MLVEVLRLAVTVILAFFVGKVVSALKLPSILGWLVTGMIAGPYALSLMNNDLLNAGWYQTFVHILECAVGLMIGTELVWKKLKKSGTAIIVTTFTQSIGTFLLVSAVFAIVFRMVDIPMYLAFIFGGIALATAPAPALSIVREFRTKGSVTNTLIPMAALDDIIGCIVFFSVISIIAGRMSGGGLPGYVMAMVVISPLVAGALTGLITGAILKRVSGRKSVQVVLVVSILLTSLAGFAVNNLLLPKPMLNFMLLGMAFSAAFSNMISKEQLESLMRDFNPLLGISMIIVILNLGAPLDYHLIAGAGLFTFIYITVRAAGKYFGAWFGAKITNSPVTVRKYLGLTLLPHSGVSLVFTGIAVSTLNPVAPECSQIIQGTIAAAAVINEIIAVIVAKKGFGLAAELSDVPYRKRGISQIFCLVNVRTIQNHITRRKKC